MKQTLYDILEVERDASFEDIEIAYTRRFEKLRGETNWDSNRFVMLNEAREVLSEPAKRAAYDASLALSARREAQPPVVEIEDAPRSVGKWMGVGIVVLAIVVWLLVRGETPSDELATAPAATEGTQPETDDEEFVFESERAAEEVDEEILSELEELSGLEEAEPDVTELSVAESTAASAVTEPGGAPGASILGFWDCYEPVTGLSTEYGFGADGTLSIQAAGGARQSFTYEMAGGRITLVDAEPPEKIGIEELKARRLVLSTSGAGQRVVCKR
ncbi:MAG: DnaJ domain-containing protein [Burkholderiales bacterium]|nr:DnaJ domain-containing protein [Burkholderiales bacterium]